MELFPETLRIIRIMAEVEDEVAAEAVGEQPELKDEAEEEVRFPMLELLKNRHWKMKLMKELLYMQLLITQELVNSMQWSKLLQHIKVQNFNFSLIVEVHIHSYLLDA